MHCFAHVHRRRKPSAPGAFCTVLSMSTGGVSHLLQVLFGLFCSWSKWLKPPAFCAKSCKGLVEARGAFRVCLVQNPAFCGFQVARRESGGVEPPTWDHLCPPHDVCLPSSAEERYFTRLADLARTRAKFVFLSATTARGVKCLCCLCNEGPAAPPTPAMTLSAERHRDTRAPGREGDAEAVGWRGSRRTRRGSRWSRRGE